MSSIFLLRSVVPTERRLTNCFQRRCRCGVSEPRLRGWCIFFDFEKPDVLNFTTRCHMTQPLQSVGWEGHGPDVAASR